MFHLISGYGSIGMHWVIDLCSDSRPLDMEMQSFDEYVEIFCEDIFLFIQFNLVIDIDLAHCGLVMPYGGRDLSQHWFR